MFPKLIVSDLHIHERLPRTRVAEFTLLVRKLRVLNIKRNCRSLTILGDIYDRNTLVSIQLIMNIASIFNLFESVELLVGNHDTPIRGYEYSLLDLFTLGGAKVISKPTVIDGCLYLPYYSKDWIEGRYRMAFMHKDIVELNPYSDKDWALSLNGLPDTDLLFNGHLHKNAEIVNGARKLIQVGSPYPCSWGDSYADNRFAYIVQADGSYERIDLNITADSDAPDADQFAMTRTRPEKHETENRDISLVIEDIKNNTIRVEDCLNAVDVDPVVKRLIKGVVRNADAAELDGSKL